MGGIKVAILGAGRMGTLLAHRLPGNCRKVIICRRKAAAVAVADEVGGVASDQYSAVRGCAVVFLAIPAHAVMAVLQDLLPHLDEETVVANLATDLLTAEIAPLFGRLRLVAAKVIGSAREIANGSQGMVVVDRVNAEEEELLTYLMGGLGPVTRDDESKVLQINTAVAEEMVRAEQAMRRRLEAMGLGPDLLRVAIKSTGAGILRALADGDAGSFLQDVVRRLREAVRDTAEGRPETVPR